jgi:hypothetical protein
VENILTSSMNTKPNDNYRIGPEESRPDPKRGRFLRDTFRGWGLFRIPDKTQSPNRHTSRRKDVVGDNLLRCHLFGAIG